MIKVIVKLVLVIAALSLAGCSTYSNNAPSWMPGSNAIKVNLTGTDEVPPLSVPGSGSGTIRVEDDGTVSGSITTKDVAGTMAHIHRGAKGTNGPVIVPLDKKADNHFESKPGAKFTDEQYQAYRAGRTYVNVHSDAHKGGEIRAQLKGS